MQALAFLAVFGSLSWYPVGTFANPLGEVVISGNVDFARNGSTLDVFQSTNRAIIEWQGFSIANGESTVFHQPGSNAVALNRVVGGSQSFIDGLLKGNGNVWVVNRNGIIVGRNGRIDVNGLMLSTLDVSNEEFMNGGDMSFSGLSTASVVNFGTINAAHGNAFVFAQKVENDGYIGAVDGHVVMLGSNEVLLHQGGMSGNVSVKGTVGYGHAYNSGEVEAAEVTMGAVNNNAMAMAVQQKGTMRITGAEKRNGRVLLVAQGGAGLSQDGQVNSVGGTVRMESDGQVQVGGTTDVSNPAGAGGEIEVIGREINVNPAGLLRANGTTGGEVKLDASGSLDVSGTVETMGSTGEGGTSTLTGNEVTLRTGASVNASGGTGGGEIFVGGGFHGANPAVRNATNTTVETGAVLNASSTLSGDGGRVAAWADGTMDFQGRILAEGIGNGGFVEVSGKDVLGFSGEVSTLGRDGNAGLLLLDPVDVVISGAGTPGSIAASSLQTAWLGGNVVVHTYGGTPGTSGHVNIEENVQIINSGNNAHSLGIFAHGDINVGSAAADGRVDIRHQGSGNITLVAGWAPNPGTDYSAVFAANPAISASDFPVREDAFYTSTWNYGIYGIGSNGVIRLNPDNNKQSAIRIGSAHGETNLFGRQLVANGGNSTNDYVHVGWYHDGTNLPDPVTGDPNLITGDVNVRLTEKVDASLIASGGVGARQYIQFGHGAHGDALNNEGATPPNGASLTGDISIESPGQTLLQAGRGSNSYVIVGHGGRLLRNIVGTNNRGIRTMSGDITVNTGGLIMIGRDANSQNFSLIGHGGQQIDGPSAGQWLETNSNIVVTSTEGIRMVGGRDDAFVQIGSGGWQVRGNHTGSIQVTARSDIDMLAANPPAQGIDQSHVMIGFGGWDADGTHMGDINVESTAGSVTMKAGGAFLDTSVDPAVVRANESFVQIGHGGRASSTDPTGAMTKDSPTTSGGEITVTAAQNVMLIGTEGGNLTYQQIGHGGDDADGTRSGNITVTATNGIVSLIASPTEVDSEGVRIGDDDVHNGTIAPSQIGHGGRDSAGDHSGDIRVTAGDDISLIGGTEQLRYALIGHGGRFDGSFNTNTASTTYLAFSANDGGDMSGDIYVTSGGEVTLLGGGSTTDFAGLGDESFAQIGHSHFRANPRFGATRFATLDGGGNLVLNANRGSTATGNIVVTAAEGVALQGGTRDDSWAAIGHGAGRTTDGNGDVVLTGNVDVTTAAGDIRLLGGGFSGFESATSELFRYATIGHHGGDAGFNAVGDITVTSALDDVIVEGGTQRLSGSRIGHGGDYLRRGTATQHSLLGAVTVSAPLGNVNVTGGMGYTPPDNEFVNATVLPDMSYGMIGHGGSAVGVAGTTSLRDYLLSGAVTVSGQNVDVNGGDGSGNFGAIGHGAYQFENGFGDIFVSGIVDVTALTDITIDGGDGISNNVTGTLYPETGRNFVRNEGNFGQIGHFGVPVGNSSKVSTAGGVGVNVTAGRDIALNRTTLAAGGSWGLGAHALIGVGGNGYVSVDRNGNLPVMDINADVSVAAGRDILLYGATTGTSNVYAVGVRNVAAGQGAVAQIGNGGPSVDGGTLGIKGDISVRSRNDILLRTGVRGTPDTGFGPVNLATFEFNNYTKIGHGDYMYESGAVATSNFRDGNVEVASGRNLTVLGGMIGHVDPRLSGAIGLTGSTFVAVDRNDGVGPDGGVLLVDVNADGVASALEANALGQLRIYTPTRSQNKISQTTYLNSVTAPFEPYDHPNVAGGTFGENGIALLRAGDELYDQQVDANGLVTPYERDQFFRFSSASGAPASLNPFASNRVPRATSTPVEYLLNRDYTIYYHNVVLARSRPQPPVERDLTEEERKISREMDRTGNDLEEETARQEGSRSRIWPYRIRGATSAYPEEYSSEEWTIPGMPGAPAGALEIFSWSQLMDWQAGALSFVPGTGLVPLKEAVTAPEGGMEVPTPPAEGEKPFDFDFDQGAAQEEEGQPSSPDAMEGSTEAAPKEDGAGMGAPAPDPFAS